MATHNQKLQILCILAARHHRHGAVSAGCGQDTQDLHKYNVSSLAHKPVFGGIPHFDGFIVLIPGLMYK
jgi:hypothetical protein